MWAPLLLPGLLGGASAASTGAEQCDAPGMGGLCGLVLAPCAAAKLEPGVRWALPLPGAKPPAANIALLAPAGWRGMVVDIGGWDNQTGSWLHVWNRTTANWQAINQQWRTEPTGAASGGPLRIVSLMNGLCLTAQSAEAGAHVQTET